jgi:hypothetical protein
MRFATIATVAAAAVAAPFAVSAAGPQMSGDQFLSAVRCTAYEDIGASSGELAEAKWLLNTEARLQPAETAAQARAEVREIARKAVNTESAADAAIIHQERAAACANGQLASGADSPSAV